MRYKTSFLILYLTIIVSSFADQPQIIRKDEVENTTTFPTEDDFARIENPKGLDSFYDPNIDYSKFSGRVSDKDETSTVLKIQVESRNTKFFKASDPVEFKVANKRESKPCQGNVRANEGKFLTIFVKNLYPCWGEAYNFRRGTILIFESERLAQRVKDASRYRVALLSKRRDFLFQLNNVNKFVWGFSQEQVDVASEYDRKILEIQKQKEIALSSLLAKKRDQIRLQKELTYRMDELDQDLSYYLVEKDELFTDRWHLDHESGLPTYERPAPVKSR